MRKKDKFIFYLGGIVAPYFSLLIWIIAVTFVMYIPFLALPLKGIITVIVFPILCFKIYRKVQRYQLRKYTKDLEQSSKDKIISLAQNWLNFHVVIFAVSILLAIVTPMFVSIKTVPSSSVVKNVLAYGVQECVVRNANNKSTKFGDVQSFSGKYSKFKIKSLDPISCFKAKAVPTNNKHTWFEIDFNMETGGLSKTCGDSSKSGCEEGNTW